MYDSRGQLDSARGENGVKQGDTEGSQDKIQRQSLDSQKNAANFGELKGLATSSQVEIT
jgi:hypothetical protein